MSSNQLYLVKITFHWLKGSFWAIVPLLQFGDKRQPTYNDNVPFSSFPTMDFIFAGKISFSFCSNNFLCCLRDVPNGTSANAGKSSEVLPSLALLDLPVLRCKDNGDTTFGRTDFSLNTFVSPLQNVLLTLFIYTAISLVLVCLCT